MSLNGSTLYISARSPFARRVRIAFLEHEIDYSEKVLNVFDSNPILEKYNPLRRVPTLVLRTGEEIVDSTYILQALYDEKRTSPFMPFDHDTKLKCFNWSGIAVGLLEKFVEYFLETLRTPSQIDETVKQEVLDITKDTLARLESQLNNKKFILGDQISQADIDWGCAIGYLKLRMPGGLSANFPNIQKYFEVLNKRPAFLKTVPPPA